MATISTNLNLTLPAPADDVNVTLHVSNNFEKIDKFAGDVKKLASDNAENIEKLQNNVGDKPEEAPNYFDVTDSVFDALKKLDAKIKEIEENSVVDVFVENGVLTVEYGDGETEEYTL